MQPFRLCTLGFFVAAAIFFIVDAVAAVALEVFWACVDFNVVDMASVVSL